MLNPNKATATIWFQYENHQRPELLLNTEGVEGISPILSICSTHFPFPVENLQLKNCLVNKTEHRVLQQVGEQIQPVYVKFWEKKIRLIFLSPISESFSWTNWANVTHCIIRRRKFHALIYWIPRRHRPINKREHTNQTNPNKREERLFRLFVNNVCFVVGDLKSHYTLTQLLAKIIIKLYGYTQYFPYHAIPCQHWFDFFRLLLS